LTNCERQALVSIEPQTLTRFADALDPCLQKSDLSGGVK
jgi:hypothetical protein